MRKRFLFSTMMILAASAVSLAVDAHWQPVADPNNPGAPGMWMVAQNWSTGVVPNGTDQTIWMATANSAACVLESGNDIQINQLKLGEGSDQSNNGHLIVKGTITTADNWTGVGAWGGQTGVLEVDGGTFSTLNGGHMWCGNQGNGTLIMRNGGTINVGVGGGAQLGLGWDGGTGVGRAFIYDGLLTVNNWTTGSIHPNTPSYIDIELGTLSIAGYRFSPAFNNATAVNLCAQDGRIRGFEDADFDKAINVDNPGNNNENDIINNVVLKWDGSRTIVTAIHPQQPAPYFNDLVVAGDIELGWNNWDPNVPGGSVSVQVYLGTDPNKLNPAVYPVVYSADVTGQARTTATVNIPTPAPGEEVTYYWQVTTDNGAAEVHEGDLFWFTAVGYKEFAINNANSVWTTLDLMPAVMSASITDYGTPLTSVTFELLNEDMGFPAGSDAAITSDVSNLNNPACTLTTTMAGLYKVLMTVTDGVTTKTKMIAVDVYADACAAKKASPGGWTANYYDRDGDCDVDVADFAVLALAWLNDTSMQVQETADRTVTYIPQSAFDNRIEGESVNPDAVSDAPVTDEQGVRIVNEGGATGGGKALGWCGNGTWAEFEITVAEAGLYDVYLSVASSNASNTLSFGTAAEPALYGSATVATPSQWGVYVIRKGGTALNLPAGTYTVRVTWTNANANLDWFSLIPQ